MSDTSICSATILRDAASQVFTTMIFMDIDPTAEIKENLREKTCVVGSITFAGNYEGSLAILCSMDCAKSITTNLLALDEDDEVEQSDIADAIGEVANMVMGSVKALAYDTVGELSSSAPTVFSGETVKHRLRAGEVKLSTTVGVDEEYCLEVHMTYMDGK